MSTGVQVHKGLGVSRDTRAHEHRIIVTVHITRIKEKVDNQLSSQH